MTEPLPAGVLAPRQAGVVDLLDRLLAGGVVLAGQLTLRIADVDLVRIDLRALITACEACEGPRRDG
ncbi:gas vesicle protein [Streptomyces sp. 6N223]|uniref:gas vesicle protein n=1 Tax=Streptomyces sp. 6N223 TaxID=3457412 RepID=UPI003FD04FFA